MVGMMCITGGGIYLGNDGLGNGANLAYTREVFQGVGGFEGIDHLASGDDVLLMQKFVEKYPEPGGFCQKQSCVCVYRSHANRRGFLPATTTLGHQNITLQRLANAVGTRDCFYVL